MCHRAPPNYLCLLNLLINKREDLQRSDLNNYIQVIVNNWMNAQKKQLFSPFFLFAVILLIPSLIFGLSNGSKLFQIYVTQSEKYEITKGKLLTNDHRKYNNNATYQFNYRGNILEGSDGSILWEWVGKEITIYFEKNNTENNGIISELIFLALSQWLLFIVLGTYVSLKIIRNARTP